MVGIFESFISGPAFVLKALTPDLDATFHGMWIRVQLFFGEKEENSDFAFDLT